MTFFVNKVVVRPVEVQLDFFCLPPPIITSPVLHIIIVVVVIVVIIITIIIIIFIAERNYRVGSIVLPYLWVEESKLGPLKEFPWKVAICFYRYQNRQQWSPCRAGSLRGGGNFWDIWNAKTYINPFPGKADIEGWRNFENLSAVCLWRHTLHFVKYSANTDNVFVCGLDFYERFPLLSVYLIANDV